MLFYIDTEWWRRRPSTIWTYWACTWVCCFVIWVEDLRVHKSNISYQKALLYNLQRWAYIAEDHCFINETPCVYLDCVQVIIYDCTNHHEWICIFSWKKRALLMKKSISPCWGPCRATLLSIENIDWVYQTWRDWPAPWALRLEILVNRVAFAALMTGLYQYVFWTP